MPRAKPIHEQQLLYTFKEAATLLSVDVREIRALVSTGHIEAHPVLAERITRRSLEAFALHYGDHAKADATKGWEVDDSPPAGTWEVPSLCVRPDSRASRRAVQ